MKKHINLYPFSLGLIMAAVILASVSMAVAQDPVTTFQKNYGGPIHDSGYAVQQTTDGGFIIAGFSESYGAGESDLYLIKTDAEGHIIWEKTFGGAYKESATSVVQTSDGGYVVAGYKYPDTGNHDEAYFLKTDADGVLQWERTVGGSDSDRFHSVVQTSDGGLVFTGYLHSIGGTTGPTCLLKTDAFGNQLWLKQYGDRASGSNTGDSVQQTSDGGFIVCGDKADGPEESNLDMWLFKTDSDGELIWEKTFGGADKDEGYSVHETPGGGFIAAGMTRSFGAGSGDVFLVKTDEMGNAIWEKTFGSVDNEIALSVDVTSDGGIVAAGWTNPIEPGLDDVYMIKTDASGALLWERKYGGISTDQGFSIQETADKGLVIAGGTHSFGNWGQVYLVKTDAQGDQLLILGAGESLWVQTEIAAPDDFNGMTLFWGTRVCENASYLYNVYRPEGYSGGIEFPLGCDLSPFQGNTVIFEIINNSGQVQLVEDAYVWDIGIPGGMVDFCGYPYYFGFYKFDELGWSNRQVVGYVPGQISDSEIPHGDLFFSHYALQSPHPSVRSDFLESTPVLVSIDIKPGDSQNSINLGSAGVIPVAILSTFSFDATTVDPDSILLEGAGVKVVGKGNRHLCHTEDINGDGLLDIICQIDTAELMIEPGDSICVLEADTYNGIHIRGEDTVHIVHGPSQP